jgi:putative ABC transport system permease protein
MTNQLRMVWRRVIREWRTLSVVTAILASGLTMSTALYSVVDGVVLRPLPFRDPASLFVVGVPFGADPTHTYIRRRDYAELSEMPGVTAVAGYMGTAGFFGVNFAEDEGLFDTKVTAGFFELLGVRPRLGRTLGPSDVVQADLRNVAIGDGLWRRRFAADQGVLGRVEVLGGRRVVIVGVMPRGFDFPLGTNVWVPETPSTWAGQATFETLVRMKGASRAPSDLSGAGARIVVRSLQDYLLPQQWMTGAVLFLGAALTLLLAWVHLAAFQMGRAFGRGKELAVQAALGARRMDLLAPWFCEAILINGAATGIALSLLPSAIAGVLRLLPPTLTLGRSVSADGRVVAFGTAISVLGSIVLTLGPLLVVRDARLSDALHGRSSLAGGRSFKRVRAVAMTLQVALVAVLLYAAGAAVHGYTRLRAVDVGMVDVDRLMWIELPRPSGGIGTLGYDLDAACRDLENLPSVASATPGIVPFLHESVLMAVSSGMPGADERSGPLLARMLGADRKYFATLGIPVLEGGVPDEPSPRGGGVVISLALSRSLGLEQPVVGRTILVGGGPRTVVAVVGDVRADGPAQAPLNAVYELSSSKRAIIVRTKSSSRRSASQILVRLRTVTGEKLPMRVRFGSDFYEQALSGHRGSLLLLSICGLASLVLAGVSVFAAASAMGRERLKETAIRLVLGATQPEVLKGLLGPILLFAGAGLLLGLIGGLAIARWASSVFFGVNAVDVSSLLGAALIVLSCVSAAAIGPVRRLTRASVFAVLKEE